MCNYCDKHWERGEPCELEGHLANHCSKAPNGVIREYLAKVLLLDTDKMDSITKIIKESFQILQIKGH